VFILCALGLVLMWWVVIELIHGSISIADKAYPWLVVIYGITFCLCVLILPLAFFNLTRGFAGNAYQIASYIFGLTTWVWSLLLAYSIWGIWSVLIGIFLAGVGIFPIAIIASATHGLWSTVGGLIGSLILTYGVRFLGTYLIVRSQAIIANDSAISGSIHDNPALIDIKTDSQTQSCLETNESVKQPSFLDFIGYVVIILSVTFIGLIIGTFTIDLGFKDISSFQKTIALASVIFIFTTIGFTILTHLNKGNLWRNLNIVAIFSYCISAIFALLLGVSFLECLIGIPIYLFSIWASGLLGRICKSMQPRSF